MDNLGTTNVPVIATDLHGLALAIQDGFEKIIQEEEWVCIRGFDFILLETQSSKTEYRQILIFSWRNYAR